MSVALAFVQSPIGEAVIGGVLLFVASELKGYNKGGSLVQSYLLDPAIKLGMKFASPEAKSLVADLLKLEGKDPAQILPPSNPPQA